MFCSWRLWFWRVRWVRICRMLCRPRSWVVRAILASIIFFVSCYVWISLPRPWGSLMIWTLGRISWKWVHHGTHILFVIAIVLCIMCWCWRMINSLMMIIWWWIRCTWMVWIRFIWQILINWQWLRILWYRLVMIIIIKRRSRRSYISWMFIFRIAPKWIMA